ncbi:MAG TPA: response regulator [Nitrospiraceae bacterium]|nr:response regulator [Nitrospiraceae bacterium]
MNRMNRVLIVDDDEAGRLALSTCLASSGYEPTEASDGMEALIRLQTGAYALVITDYRMPGLNGIELMQIVRKKWKIPVLLISGHLTEVEEQVAILSEACVLRKPIDRDTLLPLVKLAIQRGSLDNR